MTGTLRTIKPPTTLRFARVTFTGKLACLSRKEAAEAVQAHGGYVVAGVSRRTTLVVVGMGGWPLLENGVISAKLRRAEELNRAGGRIPIISEAVFLELAGLRSRQAQLAKTLSAQQVCDSLDIPQATLRRWELLGLVQSHEDRFDFQDLVSLRTVASLVANGVKPQAIAANLQQLSRILPGTERPLAQLQIIEDSADSIAAEVGDRLIAPDGQLLLGFGTRPDDQSATIVMSRDSTSADDAFARGEFFEEEERYSEAAAAYRDAINARPDFADAHFNLANVLRALENDEDAEQHYRKATKHDPLFAAAWFNLADLVEEYDRVEDAIDCLRTALKADPTFADAHFNLASCMEKVGQHADAKKHWRAYLQFDQQSEWAKLARTNAGSNDASTPISQKGSL